MDSTDIFRIIGSKNASLYAGNDNSSIRSPEPINLDSLICFIAGDRTVVSFTGLSPQEKIEKMRSSGYISEETITEAKEAWEKLHKKKLKPAPPKEVK